jgi:benzil reductase ((S)-benzoin forming)
MSQTIFLTGVSSGIGLALAKAYLDAGAHVYGLSRREPKELAGRAGFRFASVDLARLDAISAAVTKLLEGADRLDLVVLNAGVLGEIADLAETDLERMRAIMDVNLWANKPVLDAVFSGAGAKGISAGFGGAVNRPQARSVGQVVAISSGAAVNGARGWNGYALSKAALNMLMKLYAAERPETHFSALAPGLVDTAMQEAMRRQPADPRFPTLDRLRRAAGTAEMPDPDGVAPRILAAIPRLAALKSGEFHDLRTLH